MNSLYDDAIMNMPLEIYYDDLIWNNGIGYAHIFPYKNYIITTYGDIINIGSREPRFVKQWPTNHGHLYVDLSENGVRTRYLVHRLVAEAFLTNLNNYPIVRHLDDDPTNNYYRNLAWGTALDNRKDMIRNGHDFKRGVYCYEDDIVYRTCREAARDLDVNYSMITMCCKGLTHTCKGKHLCYLSDIDEKLDDPDWLRERSSFKPLIAISPEGEEFYFNSRKEAAKFIGIPDCGISNTISGHTPHSHGWRFKDGATNGETD